MQLFVTDDGEKQLQRANKHGVYKVRVCKNGQWQFVRLDDYFPCSPDAGPVYSAAHGNELWVLLVEKAMAKLCGHYGALSGGWAYEALMVSRRRTQPRTQPHISLACSAVRRAAVSGSS